METPGSLNAAQRDRAERLRAALADLSQAHTDRIDETFITSALGERARIFRAIHEVHGAASPLAGRVDHREIVISVIDERIRRAALLFESLVGISGRGLSEKILNPDGSISVRASDG